MKNSDYIKHWDWILLQVNLFVLQVAIAAFFDNDDAPMEEESFRPPIPEPVEEDLPPSAPAGANSGISRSSGPVKQPKKPRYNNTKLFLVFSEHWGCY